MPLPSGHTRADAVIPHAVMPHVATQKANRSLVDIGHVPAASDHHLTDLHTARHLALALVREELLGGGGRGTRPSHGAAEHASGGKGGGSIYNGGGDSGGTSGQAAAASAPGVSVLGSVDGDAATAEEAHQAYLLGVKHSAGWAEGEDEVAGAGSYAPGEVERLRTAPHLPAYLRAAAQHKLLVRTSTALLCYWGAGGVRYLSTCVLDTLSTCRFSFKPHATTLYPQCGHPDFNQSKQSTDQSNQQPT